MNESLTKIKTDNLTLIGQSVAGEETVVAVPELNVCFDVGRAPRPIISIDNVLLTHGHMDHSAGIAYYFAQRNFRGVEPGRLLLPAALEPAVHQMMKAVAMLEGHPSPYQVVPMKDGQDFPLRDGLIARAFATPHVAHSLGFSVIEVRQKLRAEYFDRPGHELAKLRREGVQITRPVEMPLVCYLGDTGLGSYRKLEHVRKAKILIAECTFFERAHKDRALAGRHMHVDDLAELLQGVESELIVLTHLSRRTRRSEAKKILKKTLPAEIADRIALLM